MKSRRDRAALYATTHTGWQHVKLVSLERSCVTFALGTWKRNLVQGWAAHRVTF